jgi:hypothetical protein
MPTISQWHGGICGQPEPQVAIILNDLSRNP